MSNWLGKLGLGFRSRPGVATNSASASSVAQGTDDDIPAQGQQFAKFGAGCFWGVELVFQRIPGVSKTEVDTLRGLHTIRVIMMFVRGRRIIRMWFGSSSIPRSVVMMICLMRSGLGMIPPPSIARGMMWGCSTDQEYTSTHLSNKKQHGSLWRSSSRSRTGRLSPKFFQRRNSIEQRNTISSVFREFANAHLGMSFVVRDEDEAAA